MLYRRTRHENARKTSVVAVLARANYALNYGQVANAVGIFPIRQVARDLQRYAHFDYVRRRQVAGPVTLLHLVRGKGAVGILPRLGLGHTRRLEPRNYFARSRT